MNMRNRLIAATIAVVPVAYLLLMLWQLVDARDACLEDGGVWHIKTASCVHPR